MLSLVDPDLQKLADHDPLCFSYCMYSLLVNTTTNPAPSYCIMKKRNLFPVNEMDLKLSKIVCLWYVYTMSPATTAVTISATVDETG